MCVRRKNGRLQSGEQLAPVANCSAAASLQSLGTTVPALTDYSLTSWQTSRLIHGKIHLWTMPPHLSQSYFAGRSAHSSACTLISVTVARYLHMMNARLPNAIRNSEAMEIPSWMLTVLANAMLDGNSAHANAMDYRTRNGLTKLKDTFTVPQAIAATGGGVHEIDWMVCRGPCIINLAICIHTAVTSPVTQSMKSLYFVVIMVERATLIFVDRENETVAIFDSHSHQKCAYGSFISLTKCSTLGYFVAHIRRDYFPDMTPDRDAFEISCVQILTANEKSSETEVKSSSAEIQPITCKLFPRELAKSAPSY